MTEGLITLTSHPSRYLDAITFHSVLAYHSSHVHTYWSGSQACTGVARLQTTVYKISYVKTIFSQSNKSARHYLNTPG